MRLDLGYDGTAFSGWARQPGLRTVQGVLEAALQTVLRLDDAQLVVAGRTDAGVHARGQVAHLDVPLSAAEPVLDPAAWRGNLVRRLAGVLPEDVRVFRVIAAPPGFDARFGALWRSYCYRISDADHGVDPLRRSGTVAWRHSLDAAAMHEAGQPLLGLHDFAAFCRRRDGATTIRTAQQLQVRREDEQVVITIQADAFCHSMVRSIVGALSRVGEGARPVDWPASLLELGHRSNDVPVAPPGGLTLTEVRYPPDAELAARAEQTRGRRELPVAEAGAG